MDTYSYITIETCTSITINTKNTLPNIFNKDKKIIENVVADHLS